MGVAKRLSRKWNPFFAAEFLTDFSTLVAGAEATNVVTVTGQLKDQMGNNLTRRTWVQVWLSNSGTTAAIITTAPSGGGAISGGFGSFLGQPVANKIYDVITDAAGKFAIAFTEAGALTAFLWMRDAAGQLKVSNQLTWT